jgi:hypothetical protein
MDRRNFLQAGAAAPLAVFAPGIGAQTPSPPWLGKIEKLYETSGRSGRIVGITTHRDAVYVATEHEVFVFVPEGSTLW